MRVPEKILNFFAKARKFTSYQQAVSEASDIIKGRYKRFDPFDFGVIDDSGKDILPKKRHRAKQSNKKAI